MRRLSLVNLMILSVSLGLIACQTQSNSSKKPAEKPDPSATKPATPAAKPATPAAKPATPAAKPAEKMNSSRVFFVSPAMNAKVKSPVKVVFGVEGMKIRPAGEDLADQSSGHHHLIIDGSFIKAGVVVPMNKTHIHFGKGQTETSIKLTPGKHSLLLQFADGAHKSYGEKMSAMIQVEVE